MGEIDCREGILQAVERDIYESVEEGIKSTISGFVKVLVQLRSRKSFRIFIHPIPPVLNETRPIVSLFNKLYKQAIDDLQSKSF